MDNMLLKNHHANVYEMIAQGQHLLKVMELSQLALELGEETRNMQQKTVPTIMFYGLYNAGKSTLINALCRKEVAKVGDIPTTTTIQTVPWNDYNLVDTPGIHAQDEHTRIAIEELIRSDLILFVVDNADGFEREVVARAVVEVLRRQKPIAVVINQKNVDESEDPDIPVPQQPSIAKVSSKILENLRQYARQNGFDLLDEKKNFLGIFPLNAKAAFDASLCVTPSHAQLLYENSGISSLVHAIDQVIRTSAPVRMLLTPATCLKEKLKEALVLYQNATLFSDQQSCASERKRLLESRQRTSDRLMTEGLRKIEASFEQIRTLAAEGRAVDQIPRELEKDLNALIRDVTQQESQCLHVELEAPNLSASHSDEADSTFQSAAPPVSLSGTPLSDSLIQMPFPIDIPIHIVLAVVDTLLGWLISRDREELEAERQARQSAEQMAAFYKWQNELRDQEAKTKANYAASVEQLLKQVFDGPMEKLSQQLAQMDDTCARYTETVQNVEALIARVSEEISELSLAL